MNWTLLDYVVAGALLLVLGSGLWWLLRPGRHWARRLADFGMIGGNVLLFWVNGAVGVIGAAEQDANLLYLALPAMALIGVAASRWRRRAMCLASLASAGFMGLTAGLAIGLGWGEDGPVWPADVLVITAVFGSGFLFAAWLYRRADRADAAIQAASSRAR
ncbi:hypothetical protein [Maricaulis sp.]|uniref:hypothetical protein n=1 Tax=Maricaulis sp. TaxID=1486257 RepID=UPI0025F409BB|nr:hypothetical protein [Maricaulis sp.]MDF1767593.1 hypothetical protein [Maricaulis sp.]